MNTQYAGNTVGFKKPSLRLAIRKADREGWLAEFMFAMGVHGPGGRATYFTGAYPSFCGKTSTAMIPGETIVGDDLAHLRKRDGEVWAVRTPTGFILGLDDLKNLFRDVLSRDYTHEQYVEQFTLRIPENLAKIERIEQIYRTEVEDAPQELFDVLAEQRRRLEKTKERWGEYVSPINVFEICP